MELKEKTPLRMGRAWIELDRANLRHNVKVLQTLLPVGCELMPAVKANAYGHGANLISTELNAIGIVHFCVATVIEGEELRKNGITGEILILGYTAPEQFSLLCRWHLTQTVLDAAYAEALNAYGEKIDVQIKLDTGMHRLGERCESLDTVSQIFQYENMNIVGVFSHLCVSDGTMPQEKNFTLAQGRAFHTAIAQLRARGCCCPKVHLLASYGLLNYPELGGDYARVGIALYGALSDKRDEETCTVDLRPVLSLKARVALIKNLYPGERAGYGLQFTTEHTAKLAVLAIGYADGLPRSLSCGIGAVLLHGRKAPIVGRICMDQTIVDITGLPPVFPGDEAILIGSSGRLNITASDLAEQAHTISNEILSRLGARLERVMK